MQALKHFKARLAGAAGIVIITIIGWQGGALFSHLLMSEQNPLQLSHQVTEAWMIAGQRPSVVPDALAYETLFRQQKEKPVVRQVPKTPLNMVLNAVFVAPDAADSGAIIATLRQKARYYKVGELIVDGVRLTAVQDDHVVVTRNGQQESLYFKLQEVSGPISASEGGTPASPPSVPSAAAEKTVSPQQEALVQNLPPTELGSDIQRLNTSAFMRKYQQKLQEDPDALLRQAGVQPARGGGYRLGDSPYASLMSSAGLKEGDVVLSVNGHTLGNPVSDAALLGKLAQKKEIEVVIKRGSRQFAVTFPVTR